MGSKINPNQKYHFEVGDEWDGSIYAGFTGNKVN
jgi:hypothetical protein